MLRLEGIEKTGNKMCTVLHTANPRGPLRSYIEQHGKTSTRKHSDLINNWVHSTLNELVCLMLNPQNKS